MTRDDLPLAETWAFAEKGKATWGVISTTGRQAMRRVSVCEFNRSVNRLLRTKKNKSYTFTTDILKLWSGDLFLTKANPRL